MERNFMAQAKHYASSRQKRKIGHKVLFCLASVVVFATVYALILPAITMSNELLCGKEAHKHTEACWAMAEAQPQPELVCEFMRMSGTIIHEHNEYCRDSDGRLICRLPEVEAHTHTAECYQQRRTLICGESQELGHEHTSSCYTHIRGDLICTETGGHTHTDACYTERENRTLVCELPEEPGHEHDESCYTEEERRVLRCDQPESEDVLDEEGNVIEEGHVHNDSCYTTETESVLTCGLPTGGGHTHTDSCYEIETERELTCGLEESESHVHNDSCYEWEEQLICHEEERAPGHVHTDECYEIEEILICDKEEIIPHTHTIEECYVLKEKLDENEEDEYILVCDKPEVFSHVHTSSCVYVPETVAEETVPTLICGMEEHEHTEACYMETYPEETVRYYCGLAEHLHSEECWFDSGNLRCRMPEHQHDSLCEIPELWQETPDDVDEVEGVQLDNDFVTMTEDGYFQVTFHITGYAPLVSSGTDGENPNGIPGENEGYLPPEDGLEPGTEEPDTESTDRTDAPGDGTEVDSGLAPSPGEREPEHDPEPVRRPSASKPAAPEPPETPPATNPEEEPEPAAHPKPDPEPEPAVHPEPDPEPEPAVPIVVPVTPPEPDATPLTPEEEILNSGLSPTRMSLQRRLRLLLPEDEGSVPVVGETLTDVQVTLVEQEAVPLPEPDPAAPVSEDGEESVVEEVIPEREFSFVATLNGRELDLSQCEIKATVALSEELAAALNSRESAVQTLEEAADPPEDGNANAPDQGETPEEPAIETILTVRRTDEAGEILEENQAVVSDAAAAPAAVTLSMRSNNRLRTSVSDKWDEVFPTYNVEYYAYLQRPVEIPKDRVKHDSSQKNIVYALKDDNTRGEDVLPFLDTSGGKLPGNVNVGKDATKDTPAAVAAYPTKYMMLEKVGDTYQIAHEAKLTQLYRTIENRVFSTSTPPTTKELDAVSRDAEAFGSQVKHYNLKEVWVLEPGAADRTENSESWTKYTTDASKKDTPHYVYVTDLNHLAYGNLAGTTDETAPPEGDAENPGGDAEESTVEAVITIKKGATIRMVYDPAASQHINSAELYDYDISDGGFYTTRDNALSSKNKQDTSKQKFETPSYIKTEQNGINSGSGTNFAFGNNNAGTKLGALQWGGNKLNMTNGDITGKFPGTGRGCTFGLVEKTNGISDTGGIIFSSGVNGPDLFGSATAAGKRRYSGKLDFSSHGDTYTLTSVSKDGKTWADELQNFSHPGGYRHIWSNNFWPMDQAPSYGTDGHDPKFGAANANVSSAGYKADSSLNLPAKGAEGAPRSDDGENHNSYFGMKYSVDFQIPAEYVGPLEYFFYGDDDMWVYLLDSNGSRLVCDIGGVHSSVGEYVNLWDYINQDEVRNSENGKSYRLVFFYTERGASGSTCWMQYTLPNITDVPVHVDDPSWEDESLQVQKVVKGDTSHLTEEQQSYKFSITLTAPPSENNQYMGGVFEGDNQIDDIPIPNGVETTFELKDGQSLKVLELPENCGYTVKELSSDLPNCHVSVQITDSKGTRTEPTDTVSGVGNGALVFTNEFYFELPATGGPGILWYTLGGGLLMAAGWLWYRKKPEGEGDVY